MSERLKLFLPLIIFIVLAILLMVGLKHDPQELPSALIGKPLPAFSLPELSTGQPVTAEQLRGKVALLNVWATWCPTCKAEHAYLRKIADSGVPVYGINYKDNAEDAKRWLTELGNPYQLVISDNDGRLGLDLGVYGAPETYLLDANGIIVYKYVGEVNEQVWQEKLQPLVVKLQQQQYPAAQ